jgi:hypothetical protein
MSAAVQVPYIVYNYVLGVFVKFVNRTDTVNVLSDTELSMAKPFTNQYAVADFPDVVPNKRRADGVEATDALAPFQIGKGLSENPKVEEGLYFAEDYTDPGYTIVSFELSFTKPLSDGVAAADTIFSLNMARATADTATIADVIAFLRILGPSDTADALSTTELSTAKSFDDQFAVVDVLDVVRGKFYSDGAGMVDTVVIATNLGIVDAASIADSGSVRMQDYCDFTYFAEDYVGEARNF